MKGASLGVLCLTLWLHIELPPSIFLDFGYSELTCNFHLGPSYYPQDSAGEFKVSYESQGAIKGLSEEFDKNKYVIQRCIWFD